MPPTMLNQPHSRTLSADFARQRTMGPQYVMRSPYAMQRPGSPMMPPRMHPPPFRTHSPPITLSLGVQQPIRQPIMQPVVQQQPTSHQKEQQPTSQQKETPKKSSSPFDSLNEFEFLKN